MNRFRLIFILLFGLLGAMQVSAQTYKAWVTAGDKAFEKHHYAEAISYYYKAAEFENGDEALFYKTAEALRMYNDYDKAAAWYTKVVLSERADQFPLALFYLAEMRKYAGMYPESKQLFEKYAGMHTADTGYFEIKASFEAQHMDEALRISNSHSERNVEQAGGNINSVYSDFSGAYFNDSIYYYSSLRFLYENTKGGNQGYYVTRILKTDLNHPSPHTENILINLPEVHNSNIAISPDLKFMVFSRCPESGDYMLSCELMESKFINGNWSKPEPISGGVNMEGYTSTQPAIATRGAEGYSLYFISDRPGGMGKMDIWKADRSTAGEYSAPENLGTLINTFDDEATPFYDSPRQILYFSSYGHAGMGGLDVFSSNWNGKEYEAPVNLLPPVNSSVNDIYFTLAPDTLKGSFASNRKGSMYIGSQTCCYDIYFFKTTVVDSVIADTVPTEPEQDLTVRASYDDFLPLVLYFDNDYPDPRSRRDTTTTDYLSLYNDYLEKRPEYLSQFSSGLTGSKKDSAFALIETFFTDSVIMSFNRLEGFCNKLKRAMNEGISITLEVRGRASPLAKTEYNIILSRRRIASLYNYLRIYDNGVLSSFLDSGQLVVKEVPAGESLAGSGISDELKDKRNSVYNPKAATERRIELINVVIGKKE